MKRCVCHGEGLRAEAERKRNHKILKLLSIDHSVTPIRDDWSDGHVKRKGENGASSGGRLWSEKGFKNAKRYAGLGTIISVGITKPRDSVLLMCITLGVILSPSQREH